MTYYINVLQLATEFYSVGADFIYKLIISNDWERATGSFIDYSEHIETVENYNTISEEDFFEVLEDLNSQPKVGDRPPHPPAQ